MNLLKTPYRFFYHFLQELMVIGAVEKVLGTLPECLGKVEVERFERAHDLAPNDLVVILRSRFGEWDRRRAVVAHGFDAKALGEAIAQACFELRQPWLRPKKARQP